MIEQEAFIKEFGERPSIPYTGKDEDDFYREQQIVWDANLHGWQAAIERQRSNGKCVGIFEGKFSGDVNGNQRFECKALGSIPELGAKLFTAPQQSPIPQAFLGMPLLNADEIALLRRFVETTEDDSSYDLSAEQVQRLAKYGALKHNGGGHYSTTEFGQWLSAAPSAPIEAQQSVTQALEAAANAVMKVYATPSADELGTLYDARDAVLALIPSTQAPKEGK